MNSGSMPKAQTMKHPRDEHHKMHEKKQKMDSKISAKKDCKY